MFCSEIIIVEKQSFVFTMTFIFTTEVESYDGYSTEQLREL